MVREQKANNNLFFSVTFLITLLSDVVWEGESSTRPCVRPEWVVDRVNQGFGGSGRSPPSFFSRPACWTARRRTNSICPLRLRRSSFAQR